MDRDLWGCCLCVFTPHIHSFGTLLEQLPGRSEHKPGVGLSSLTWALNLAESWGGVSLPDTLCLGLCDKQRGGGFLEEKEVATSRIRVKFRGWQASEREVHVNLQAVLF